MAIKKNLESEYHRYCMSNATELWDVYGRCSDKKRSAFERCKEDCESMHGHDLRIVGHNCDKFSVGWCFEEDGTEMFLFRTKSYDYVWPIPERS